MAEQKNKSAEQLLSDLHQKRLEQALNEFNADKTRMAVGRLLEEYVDDGGQSYFDGAQKDATLYFVDDDYMDKVSDVEPQDENKPKKEKKGGFFAGALSKLAEKMKTEEPDDYEDEFPDEIEEYKDDKEDDVNLIDGTNKGFDMPAPEDLEPVAPIEEEEAVPPVKPSIFDTAKLSSMDLNDIEERLEKVHLKPATMEFADPNDVLKEILGETEEEKKEEPKEEIKPVKKENRKVHKKKDSLDDISVDDMGLGNIVNKIAEEELKNKEEKPEETSSVEEVETDDNSEVSVDTNTEDVQEIEEPETEIEADTIIYPSCYISGKNKIGKHCKIGPFAHLRGDVILEDYVKIGNFVEVKKTTVKSHTNACHLTYLGDSEVGSNVNIGAGTITANYNPLTKTKSKTIIKDNVKIGSNSVLVAPITIEEGANVGALSCITKCLPPWALALTRAPLRILENWVKK